MPFLRRVAGLSILLAATIAAPADAAITSSQITSSTVKPYDYRFSHLSEAANERTIAGTAEGSPGDPVHVRCLRPSGTETYEIGSTQLGADLTWTVTGAIHSSRERCELRALPATTPPAADLGPFAAQVAYIGRSDFYADRSDFAMDVEPRALGWAEYYSVGDCGLCGLYPLNAATALFSRNATLGHTIPFDADGDGPGPATDLPTTEVDGQRAYLPANVRRAGGIADPGFVPLTVSHAVDQATGDATMTSTEAIMVCPGGCNSNVDDTGLRIERTSTLRRQGQVFDARDVVRNTGSQPRQVVLAYLNDQRWGKTHVQLPGESARTGRRNAVVELPRAAVATLAAEKPFDPSYQSEADALHGALTMAPAADAVVFTDKPAAFLTRYTFTLAPGASKSITFSYAGHATLAGVAALAKETEEALTRALVPATPPADGTPKAPEENPGVLAPTAGLPQLPGLPLGTTLTSVGTPKTSWKGRRVLVDTGLLLGCPANGPACPFETAASSVLPLGPTAAAAGRKPSRKPRRATIGRKQLTVAGGARVPLWIKLSRAASKALRAKGTMTIRLRIVSRIGSAAPVTATRTITVKAPAKRRKPAKG